MTNNLTRRTYEHQLKLIKGFTARYAVDKLAYFEEYDQVWQAIAREKQLKGWSRVKKVALIESMNPAWDDLSHLLRD